MCVASRRLRSRRLGFFGEKAAVARPRATARFPKFRPKPAPMRREIVAGDEGGGLESGGHEGLLASSGHTGRDRAGTDMTVPDEDV